MLLYIIEPIQSVRSNRLNQSFHQLFGRRLQFFQTIYQFFPIKTFFDSLFKSIKELMSGISDKLWIICCLK